MRKYEELNACLERILKMNKVLFFDDIDGLYFFGKAGTISWFTKIFDNIFGDSWCYEFYTYSNGYVVKYTNGTSDTRFIYQNVYGVASVADCIAKYDFSDADVENYFIFIDTHWGYSPIYNEFEACVSNLVRQVQKQGNKIVSICVYSAQRPDEAFERAEKLHEKLSEAKCQVKVHSCRLNRTDAVNARDLFTQAFKKIII